MKRYILILAGCMLAMMLKAQVAVQASMDSNYIYIGQQTHVYLKVTAAAKSKIVFPVFPSKQLVPGIEVLKEEVVATEDVNDGSHKSVTKCYTITSFDSAMYYLPPMKVTVDGKVDSSKSLALKVLTMDVDTLHVEKFCGPKEIFNVTYSWSDWRGIFWLSLLLLVMLLFVGYIALQIHNNRPLLGNIRLKAILPPHIWAIQEIEKLKVDEVKKEDAKEYYSELTDVLRSYIRRRYGFNATEMTSGEIIDRLLSIDDKAAIEELRQLFYTADLAKFAKLQTLLNENDENLLRAMKFINETKLDEKENPAQKKKVVPVEVKRSSRDRLILKFSVAVVSILCAGLLFHILYTIYNLLY